MKIDLTSVVRATTLAGVLLVSPMVAAEPSIADKATARTLFEDGRALVQEGKAEQACPKLKESYDLDPGAGSAFHLADCYERIGRHASAWVLFLEVAVMMRASGEKDKEAVARKRAEDLAPRLSRLTIQVPKEHAIDGLTIARDGEKIGNASWNTALPVDPGEHKITVSAPGREAWSTIVTIKGEGTTETTVAPLLPPAASEEPTPAPTLTPVTSAPAKDEGTSDAWKGQKMTGLIVGGSGLLVFGVGTFLGFRAKSNYDDSSAYCDGNVCTQEGVDIRDDARSSANIATVVGGIGLAAMVGGAVLYLTAPSGSGTETAIGVGPGSVTVRGAW